MGPRIGGCVRTGKLRMGAAEPRTGAAKLRTGAEKPRIGAEKPRPCPEADKTAPKASAATNPSLYIPLAMDLGSFTPPTREMFSPALWLQAFCRLRGAPAPIFARFYAIRIPVRLRQNSPEHATPDPSAESRRTHEKTENPSSFCPVCSARLEAHKCKLRCPTCGYYMSCSDYY